MRYEKIKLPVFCLIAFLFFSACTKDEDIFDNTGGGEEPTAGESVAALDHTILHDWTEQMLVVERYATGMRPNASARAFAYIYLAAYETAAPGMLDHGSTEDLLRDFNIRNSELPDEVDWELALNSALAEVLDHFMLNISNDLRSQIAEFAVTKEAVYSEGLSAELIADSKEWGEYVAERVIRYSESDRQAEEQILEPQPTSYEPPTGPGFWTYSADPERALIPYWESVRTFVISPNETSTVAPINYSESPNSPYFAQMMEVYNVNNEARAADGEQLWIAEFWSDDVEGLMFSPPARQYAIANQLLRQYDLNLEQALVLYLKLGFSLNDAAVATWKYKYQYMVMRPNVYIHELIDPDYQTNLYRLVYWPNPSFPGYPSGHSCFASAAGGVFIDFFGDATNFTDRSHEGRTEFRGTPRQFSTFSEMAAENAYSRIPLGVHIRMDCDEGLRLGYEISDAINSLDLRKDPG